MPKRGTEGELPCQLGWGQLRVGQGGAVGEGSQSPMISRKIIETNSQQGGKLIAGKKDSRGNRAEAQDGGANSAASGQKGDGTQDAIVEKKEKKNSKKRTKH